MKPLPSTINWLKEFRLKKKLTQNQLAKATGLSQGMISKVENGILEGNVSLLLALRQRYKFNVNRLLDEA